MSNRILFISNLFPPHVLGGYEILCSQVARTFADRGWTVSVLTTNHGLAEGEAVDSDWEGIPVSRRLRLFLPFGEPPEIDRKVRYDVTLANEAACRAYIEEWKPDVVFVWSLLRATVGAARASQALKVPTAFALNDANLASYSAAPWSRPHKAVFDRIQFRQATLEGLNLWPATCISDAVREDLIAAGVAASDARTIYQGVPIERFPLKDKPGSAHSPFRILYAGQLHDYKGVEDVIKAVGMTVGTIACELRIAGRGDEAYESHLNEISDGLPVTFLGRLTQEELASEYRNTDVLVFPSRWREPFGLTHLEAMASGTPVISTAEGGPAEFLRNGENSLVVESEDPEGIARALVRMAKDEALRVRLANEGRRLIEERFNMDRYVSELEDWLQHSVMNRPRPAATTP